MILRLLDRESDLTIGLVHLSFAEIPISAAETLIIS